MLSRNENELISIGENLGSVCQAGQVILLSGNLGAGKTTLLSQIRQNLCPGREKQKPRGCAA